MDSGTRATAPHVRVVPLDDEEREWYRWLVVELLNAVLIASSDELRAAVVLELDELLQELIARCP